MIRLDGLAVFLIHRLDAEWETDTGQPCDQEGITAAYKETGIGRPQGKGPFILIHHPRVLLNCFFLLI